MEAFETYRPYLFAIAYRMLGSAMDAEDMVQETYLRYQATPKDSITSLKAFLTTIISRLCLDQLHLARSTREQYLGPWLPEPIITASSDALTEVERRFEAYETISLAFLVLLEQLQPIERAVFLLREVFEYDYAEIAAFLGKNEVACRKSFSRAKKHLVAHRPRFPVSPEAQTQLLTSFLQAVQEGSMTALLNLLAESVTFWGDGGGKVKGAPRHLITGRVEVARFLLESGRVFRSSLPEDARVELATVNGQPALITRAGPRAFAVLTIEVEAGQIQTIRGVANPEKLTHVSHDEIGEHIMSTEANKAIARRYFEEFLHERKGVVGEDLDLFAPTYQRYFPGSPGPLDLKGHEHISITICSAYPDGRFTVEDTIAEGERVVSRFTFRGTQQGAVLGIAPTGKQVTLTGIEIHRIVEGRIVEQWSQFDALALPSLGVLQRLGVAPTPGP